MFSGFSPFIHFMQTLQQALEENLHAAPVCLWYIDTVHNRIELFSEPKAPLINVIQLFQDTHGLQGVVIPEDREAVRQAVAAARRQAPMSVLFRVRDEAGTLRPLVMTGMPAPDAPLLYAGMLACCEGLLERAMGVQSALAPLETIERLNRPVLLVSFAADRRIIHANTVARTLCQLPAQGPLPALDDVFELMDNQHMQSVYENLLFAGWWRGTLTLRSYKERPLLCSVHIRPLAYGAEHFLWVQLQPVSARESVSIHTQPPLPLPDFSKATSEQEVLDILLHEQPHGMNAEGVILSRIFPDENRVLVSNAGSFPKHLYKAEYPYTGSIAENIVRYGLDFLLVEETTRSIRPIDWALFIPQGVHSYYAEPYFVEGKIQLVLIYTSSRSGMFSGLPGGCCTDLVAAFAKHLQHIEARETR